MNHEQYHRIKNAIKSGDRGKMPRGITKAFDYKEFKRMFSSYMSHSKDSTVSSDAAKALMFYEIPLKITGMNFELDFSK